MGLSRNDIWWMPRPIKYAILSDEEVKQDILDKQAADRILNDPEVIKCLADFAEWDGEE